MKHKDLKQMSEKDKEERLKELRAELMKSRTNVAKGGSSRIKEIKKMIARILTFNK